MDKAEALAKLTELTSKYKHLERNDPDQPPKYGGMWSPRHGMIEVVADHSFWIGGVFNITKQMLFGLKIGAKWAEPKGYKYPDSNGFQEAQAARKEALTQVLAEAELIFSAYRNEHGGRSETRDGTAHMLYGLCA